MTVLRAWRDGSDRRHTGQAGPCVHVPRSGGLRRSAWRPVQAVTEALAVLPTESMI